MRFLLRPVVRTVLLIFILFTILFVRFVALPICHAAYAIYLRYDHPYLVREMSSNGTVIYSYLSVHRPHHWGSQLTFTEAATGAAVAISGPYDMTELPDVKIEPRVEPGPSQKKGSDSKAPEAPEQTPPATFSASLAHHVRLL